MKTLINLVFQKYILIIAFLFFNTLTESKIYNDYMSFDGCEPTNTCFYSSYPEKFKAFIRGFGPICTDESILMKNYFDCADRFFECGYINLYTKNNTMNPNEGVHILHGIDLSNFNEVILKELQIPETTILKLTPFFSLKGNDAANKLEAEKLQLTTAEAELIYKKITEEKLKKLKESFSKLKTNFTDYEKKFEELPLEIKTALLSQINIYGNEIPNSYAEFILNNDWDNLANKIKMNTLPQNYRNGVSYKNTLRKNLDAYLVDSVESKIQAAHLRGIFLIDLTNQYKAELKNYESYILAIKSVIKAFMDNEKCETCKNKDIHEYAVIVYRNESLLLSSFDSTANDTMKGLDRIIIPDSYAPDTRPRNTGVGLKDSIKLFLNQTLTFDKLKSIVLFTNGQPEDDFDDAKIQLENNSINLAVVDMSLKKLDDASNAIPLMAEGKYNYINYNFTNNETERNQTDNKNLKCLNKQVLNTFASQNIFLTRGEEYKNSTIYHNNTVFFQAVKPKGKNLKVSLNLNTFPEQNFLKIFVSYDYPFPDYHTSLLIHEGDNYLPLKTIVIGKEDEYPELFDTDRVVYITLVGSNSDFGVKIEECDPSVCAIGTNYNENNYPFPKWIIVLLIIFGSIVLLGGIWYVVKNYRKKDLTEDLEHGFTKYNTIKN